MANDTTAVDVVLVDVDMAAIMTGLHRATVYKLVACGKFPQPIKLGRSTRWAKDELTAWIAAKCPPLVKWERMNATASKKTGKRG